MDAASAPAASVEAISARLHDLAHAHGGVDLLCVAVDAPAEMAAPLPPELDAALRTPAAHRVSVPHRDVDASLCARWLVVDTAQASGSHLLRLSIEHAVAEVRAAALREGAGRCIAGWFTLDTTLAVAARHWGLQMLRRRPDGQRCLLRLHDPAVLWALWPLLTPVQRSQLLGPLPAWSLLDPDGHPVTLDRPQDGDASSVEAPWSTAVWQDIDCIGPLNAALRSLDAQGARAADPVEVLRERTLPALRRARAAGFTHAVDLTAYASHALTVHPEFDRHPAVRRALEQAQPGDRYASLVSTLTEQDWSAVRLDLA